MLTKLTVKNFAVLRDAELELWPGFTAITGETGSGKSLLANAIAFLVGGKQSLGIVRDGTHAAVVEGEFHSASGDIFHLRRELLVNGRTRAFLNDNSIRVKELIDKARLLIDITGQRAFSHLLDSDRHLDFLDRFARLENERETMKLFEIEYQTLSRMIRTEIQQRDQYLQRRELVDFQLNEIDTIDPQKDEDTEIAAELHRLEHFEDFHEAGVQLENLLINDDLAVETLLSKASVWLNRLVDIDTDLADLPDELESVRSVVKEIALRVSQKHQGIDFNQDKLEGLRDRQHQLAGLVRKFGGNLEALIDKRTQLMLEQGKGDNSLTKLNQLTDQREILVNNWCQVAREVGVARRGSAILLEKKVIKSLNKLGMKAARFEVSIDRISDPKGLYEKDGERFQLDGSGADRVEFYLSANIGIEPRPLSQVASGGELSRLLLSLKEVSPVTDNEALIVFDEIDTGVSGRVAELMGLKLKELSATRQLLAITHLPQIAGLADRHLSVVKTNKKTGAEAAIVELKGDDRIREIASLLSGGQITDAAIEQAHNLLVSHEQLDQQDSKFGII